MPFVTASSVSTTSPTSTCQSSSSPRRFPGSAAPGESELGRHGQIEGSVNTISGGIDELQSTSSEGVSIVIAQFVLEKPVDVAAQEVRDKVSQIMPDLPKGIDSPVVSKIDPGASPVLFAALRSKRPFARSPELADKVVRRRIESIDGVGEVKPVGARKRQINILMVRRRCRPMASPPSTSSAHSPRRT